ncbi:BnaUnng04050D [Brassica napus]|uniref:BnaUnng04050D protein n=2 Tax=Brassica TaxID=3705 RepID=A0A078JZA9_BRANA|nr:BnaUnng04050D [Brassica napus]
MYEDVGLLGFRVRLLEINQVFESIRQAFHHQKLDTNYSESLRCLVQPRMDSVKSVYEIHCINYFFTCKRPSFLCFDLSSQKLLNFCTKLDNWSLHRVCRSYCTEKLKHSFQMTTMSQTLHGWTWIRNDKATTDLKLFGVNLKLLEDNLPLNRVYKLKDVSAAPIRFFQ